MSRETRLGLLIALAGVVLAAITDLGSWKQSWTGLGTFADTPAAKWILVVSAAAALLAIGWGLKRKIDGNRRFRNELQAAVVLHQKVLLALVSGESGASVHEAIARAREGDWAKRNQRRPICGGAPPVGGFRSAVES